MRLKVLWTILEESETLGHVFCALLVQAAEYRRSGGAPAEMLRRPGEGDLISRSRLTERRREIEMPSRGYGDGFSGPNLRCVSAALGGGRLTARKRQQRCGGEAGEGGKFRSHLRRQP